MNTAIPITKVINDIDLLKARVESENTVEIELDKDFILIAFKKKQPKDRIRVDCSSSRKLYFSDNKNYEPRRIRTSPRIRVVKRSKDNS